jgi:hypothetical protein
MTASKPWYLSRTIWAALVTILTDGADGPAGRRHRRRGADRRSAADGDGYGGPYRVVRPAVGEGQDRVRGPSGD